MSPVLAPLEDQPQNVVVFRRDRAQFLMTICPYQWRFMTVTIRPDGAASRTFGLQANPAGRFDQSVDVLLEQSNSTESKNDNLPTVLQEFDPNKLDQTGWINLGFSEKQAASIIKYRERAGDFKNPEDLLKTLPDEL